MKKRKIDYFMKKKNESGNFVLSFKLTRRKERTDSKEESQRKTKKKGEKITNNEFGSKRYTVVLIYGNFFVRKTKKEKEERLYRVCIWGRDLQH